MSLTFTKGFFPFPIVDVSRIAPSNTSAVPPDLSLATLSKLWWICKSYDFTMDLAYSFTNLGISANGTAKATKTILVETSRTFVRATGAKPPERAIDGALISSERAALPVNNLNPIVYVDAGASSLPGPPYSVNRGYQPLWFAAESCATDIEGLATMAKDGPADDYLSYFDDGGFDLGAFSPSPSCTLTVGNGFGKGAVGINLTLRTPGIPDVLVPLFYKTGGTDFSSALVTGTLLFDFNQFWTP